MTQIRIILFATYFLITSNIAFSQSLYDFGFERNFSVPVLIQNNDTLDMAWIGGLNAVQFSDIDINLDGIMDILIFDRHGNVLLPFINNNVAGNFAYTFAPQYTRFFPEGLSDWIITYDFNNDGKMDIFSYVSGGIRVYKNISTPSELKFELWSPLLNSLIFSNYINIYLTDVDYPVITDVDGDGDVDILAFYLLGNYIELHKNMGVELHSNPDTMDFHRDYRCFGNFMESDMSNEVFLNITCPWQKVYPRHPEDYNKDDMHVGSSMLFIDTNGDGLKDLLLGDTDFPNIIKLINGGSQDSAHFISQDIHFPSNTTSIELFSIPVLSFLDIDNDNIKELIVSAFDPSTMINETEKSVWFYENNGSNDSLDLVFVQDDFLQNRMIEHGSGAYPVLQDWNGDGLLDLFVANFGTRDSSWYENGFLFSSYTSSIALYENIGTISSPAFQLVTDDFAGISDLGLIAVYPAFADLDGDGDIDMVIGNREGTLIYFNNTAGVGNPMNMILNTTNWLGIDVGLFSAPVFFDLNKNGLKDLIVGQRMGYLSYWENTGSISNPTFTHVTDSLGYVYTSDLTFSYYGHSIPSFYRNSLGETFLFTGSNKGWVLQFKDIDNNLNGTFQLIDTLFIADGSFKVKIVEGNRVSPFVADLNNDGYPEMILGNFRGGLSFLKGVQPPPDTVGIYQIHSDIPQFSVYPNPFDDQLMLQFDTEPGFCIIRIFSVDARVVFETQLTGEKSFLIDTSQLPSGFYVLSVHLSSIAQHSFQNLKLVKSASFR